MARKEVYTKEIIVEKTAEYVKENGIDNLTVRDLAKYMNCSTQPFFKVFSNMDELKKELKQSLRLDYEDFISKYVDTNDYLLTISYAYALYAKKKPNIFKALFISDLAGTRTINEVLKTKRNIPTIESMVKKYNISYDKAENIYRDVRFYTHGIATQLCINSINITDKELYELIQNNINLYI